MVKRKHLILKGFYTHSRFSASFYTWKTILSTSCLLMCTQSPFLKGVCSKWKEYAPPWEQILLNWMHFQKGGRPALMAQLDVQLVIMRLRLWSPPGLVTVFHGDWSWNIFYGYSIRSANSRRAVVSVWQNNVRKYWLTAWRSKPVQEKCS